MTQKIAIITTLLLILILTSCTDTTFDSQKWKNWNLKESEAFLRWDMADDLIENYNLEGKTQKEIKELLGDPDNGVASSLELYYYDLGPCRRGIDFGSLHVEFKNGKVNHVEKHCN